MNRYPLWKYAVMLTALAVGLLYTLPNLFGEAPAVQVSSGKATAKIDVDVLHKVETLLASNRIAVDNLLFDNSASASASASIHVRLRDSYTQLRVKDLLSHALNRDPADPTYIVALNLQSAAPKWLRMFNAWPMYLGLDLRGGVHFLLQIDMASLRENISTSDILHQNIATLAKRINELGVAEPVIQQQGADRIVVELPGVQDTAKAKDIIGRTATLEARLVDPNAPRFPTPQDSIPADDELFTQGNDTPVWVKKSAVFTGAQIVDASAGFDEHQRPVVKIRLDSIGGRRLRDISRDNVGKPMAMVLFEKNKGEVLTVATIQSELNEHFQITGASSIEAAKDLALLLRAGSLAAPMKIVEERMIGPSLGADNIKKGFDAIKYGFLAIAIFMIIYYQLFGIFSVIALSINLLLLIAVLSLLQATLTLPGMAAIALTLGIAIDANVLINERIREELRYGATPQIAISSGFQHAWRTILDSNATTLIAGLALFAFGSGPIRGFAVVHCIGILTSIFSSVFFARGLVNLWYGRRRKLRSLAIG